MKFFAAIMAVIVLVLSIMPCADANEMHKQPAKYEIAKESKQKAPLNDDCSPFCQCNCCTSFFVNHQIIALPVIAKHFFQTGNNFTVIEPIQVYLPIWQPPRLV